MCQAHLTKRITEVFGGVDTIVDEWATAHTDVYWSNVTVDGYLIDWEDRGAAPRGHDAAGLWQSALPDSQFAARVQHEFAEDLRTRSGRLAQRVQCANAIRRGQSTPLSEHGESGGGRAACGTGLEDPGGQEAGVLSKQSFGTPTTPRHSALSQKPRSGTWTRPNAAWRFNHLRLRARQRYSALSAIVFQNSSS